MSFYLVDFACQVIENRLSYLFSGNDFYSTANGMCTVFFGNNYDSEF